MRKRRRTGSDRSSLSRMKDLDIKAEPTDYESLEKSELKTYIKVENEEKEVKVCDEKENVDCLLSEGVLGNGNPCIEIPSPAYSSAQVHAVTVAHSIFSSDSADPWHLSPNIIVSSAYGSEKSKSLRYIPSLLPLKPVPSLISITPSFKTTGCDSKNTWFTKKPRDKMKVNLRFGAEKPSDMSQDIWDNIIKLQLTLGNTCNFN